MKARRLIASSSYGPQQLNVIFQAFDQAWEAMAADVGSNPTAIEAARLRLANVILSLASTESDPEALKNAALRILS